MLFGHTPAGRLEAGVKLSPFYLYSSLCDHLPCDNLGWSSHRETDVYKTSSSSLLGVRTETILTSSAKIVSENESTVPNRGCIESLPPLPQSLVLAERRG
jgi:hypothetical protein